MPANRGIVRVIRTAVIFDSSCAGLTRASIFLARRPFTKIDGLPGQARSSPAMTADGSVPTAAGIKAVAWKKACNAMNKTPDIVFLFDVDNTLIDNDGVQAHLSKHLEQTYGTATRDRYWKIFEQLRSELGYADYLGALERYRTEDLHRPEVLRMSSWLVDYPFA